MTCGGIYLLTSLLTYGGNYGHIYTQIKITFVSSDDSRVVCACYTLISIINLLACIMAVYYYSTITAMCVLLLCIMNSELIDVNHAIGLDRSKRRKHICFLYTVLIKLRSFNIAFLLHFMTFMSVLADLSFEFQIPFDNFIFILIESAARR